MTPPITIESIDVQGFRAYLKPQSFSLRNGRRPISLAIFAPNAKGKSSLVDAIEYYFSSDATLERLGQRAGQSQAGPAHSNMSRQMYLVLHPKSASNSGKVSTDSAIRVVFPMGKKSPTRPS